MITVSFPFFAKAYLRIQEASRTYKKGLESVFYNAHNDFTWQNTVLLAPLEVSDDDETACMHCAYCLIRGFNHN